MLREHKKTHDELNEGIKLENRKKPNPTSQEPSFYIAFIIKGTKKQYQDILKYVENRNGAQILYQCKSLTYLRVYKDEGVNIKYDVPMALEAQGAEC
jgi:hypothetical protein